MDSQPSDAFVVIGELQECARRGDWTAAARLAVLLQQQATPVNALEATEYLLRLRGALAAARAARGHLAASLARLNAAAGFHRTSADLPRRQEFGEAAQS